MPAEYRAGLSRALAAAVAKLKGGGSALDAVETAIVQLENDPQFNAGRGAAFNAEGKQEMDASIMDGSDFGAGSVAAVQNLQKIPYHWPGPLWSTRRT